MSKRPYSQGDSNDDDPPRRTAPSPDQDALSAENVARASSTADFSDLVVHVSDISDHGLLVDFAEFEDKDALVISSEHSVDSSCLHGLLENFTAPTEGDLPKIVSEELLVESTCSNLPSFSASPSCGAKTFVHETPAILRQTMTPLSGSASISPIRINSPVGDCQAQAISAPSQLQCSTPTNYCILSQAENVAEPIEDCGANGGDYCSNDCDGNAEAVLAADGNAEAVLAADGNAEGVLTADQALELCFLPPCMDGASDDHEEHNFPAIDWEASPSQYGDFFEDLPTGDSIEVGLPQESDLPRTASSTLLYDAAPITVQESLIAVLTYSLTEKLSGVALQGLLRLISLHLPSNNLFCQSVGSFFQSLESDSNIQLCFYCNSCLRPRESLSDLCDQCINEDRTVEYYVLKPIGPQILNLFKKPGFEDDILYKRQRQKKIDNNIEDIYDGQCYKTIENEDNSESLQITLTWNTDGVSPYNSSTYSMWPFYFSINELPPLKRFRREHMILAGLWGSRVKPHPNVFLIHIFKELDSLKKSGLRVLIHGSGVNIVIEVVCGSCDSPAKASFLHLKHHSGYYSCPRCLAEGERSTRTGDKIVFPYENPLVPRTSENYLAHVQQAVLIKDDYFGVKGPSILYFMVKDVFKSTSIDVMHCLYLGVTKQMLHLLFDSKFSTCPFSLSKRLKDVNKILQGITLPHFVERNVIPVDKLAFWKASLLRNFFYHIFLPVLSEVMDVEHFTHLKMLIGGVALINSESISQTDLCHAAVLLDKFVVKYQALYGISNMTHNLHLVRHLVASVEENGPTWATSCFGFESLNGSLLALIHSSTYASLQVAGNLDLITELPSRIENLPHGPAKELCEKLSKKYKRLKISEEIEQSTYSVGAYSLFTNSQNLLPQPYCESSQKIFSFQRLLKNGMLFTTNAYRKGARVSCFVQIESPIPTYGKILHFLKFTDCLCFYECKCSGTFYALVHKVETDFPFVNRNIDISEICQVDVPIGHLMTYSFSNVELVPIGLISTVCFHFCVKETSYISVPLNKMELE